MSRRLKIVRHTVGTQPGVVREEVGKAVVENVADGVPLVVKGNLASEVPQTQGGAEGKYGQQQEALSPRRGAWDARILLSPP